AGSCTGALYQVTGPTFFGTTFNPSLVNVASEGSLTLTFQNANAGSMTYSLNGSARNVSIVREPIAQGTLAAAVDYTDLWYNPKESGWGMAMAQQNTNVFLAWYVYDTDGAPIWVVAPNCVLNGSSCAGTLYSTTGPPFGPTFDPSQVKVTTAGSVI